MRSRVRRLDDDAEPPAGEPERAEPPAPEPPVAEPPPTPREPLPPPGASRDRREERLRKFWAEREALESAGRTAAPAASPDDA